jgi:hypothetical protein
MLPAQLGGGGSNPFKALDLTSGIDGRRKMPDIYRSVLPPSKSSVFRTAPGSRNMILMADEDRLDPCFIANEDSLRLARPQL